VTSLTIYTKSNGNYGFLKNPTKIEETILYKPSMFLVVKEYYVIIYLHILYIVKSV